MFKIILIIFFLNPTLLSATNWKASPNDQLSVGLGLNFPSLQTKFLADKDSDNSKALEIIPNNVGNNFITFQYANLGFSLSKNFSKKENDEISVDTKFEDYQLRFLGNRHTFNLYYQKYTGYYIKNYKDFKTGIDKNDPVNLLPNLSTKHTGVGYIYNFSPEDFSLDAAFGVGAVQTKSGGSWLASISYDTHSISNSGAILPSDTSGTFDHISDYLGGEFTSYAIGAGGAYTHIINRFYISYLIMLSHIQQEQDLKFSTGNQSGNQSTNKGVLGFALGYNHDQQKVVFQLQGESTKSPLKSGAIEFTTLSIDLMYAYRFNKVNIPLLQSIGKIFD